MKSKSEKQTIFSIASFKLLSLLVLLVLVLSSPLLFLDKEIPSIWLNSFHNPFFDRLFYAMTNLGDGLILIPVFLFLLCRSYVLAASFALFTAFEAIIVQLILKKGFFADLVRPSAYISNFDELYHVPGVDFHSLHTFPSGHTQTIFLVVFFLALALKKTNWISVSLFLIAVFTGLSRVYLLQHFLVDVWFGALIGFGIPTLIIYLLQIKGKFPQSQKRLSCYFLKRKGKYN